MPTPEKIFGYIAGAFALLAFVPYINAILKKQTKPSQTTWIIWAIQDILTLASYYVSGAKETLWVPIGFAIGATISAALSLKYGEKTWDRLDIACMIAAIASILIWPLTKSALTVLLINLFMGAVGAIPTLKKAYRNPKSEDPWTWRLFVISSLFNLLAIKEWVFKIAIYPIAITLIDGSIAAVVFWPRSQKGGKKMRRDAE